MPYLVPGPRGLELEYDVALAVDGEALVRYRRARDVAAQLLDAFTIIRFASDACVQAEALGVGAEGFARPAITRLMRLAAVYDSKHFAPCAWPHGDAPCSRGRLQRGKQIVRISTVRAREIDAAVFFDQMPQTRQ